MHLAIIIPSYNEKLLTKTLTDLCSDSLKQSLTAVNIKKISIVLVDDGSTLPVEFEQLPQTQASLNDPFQIHLLRHSVNLGQGAAIQTGVEYGLIISADIFITYDSDGQHSPEDIPRLVSSLQSNQIDIVFGSRFLGIPTNANWTRLALLKAAIQFERALTGLSLSDSHNGLRAFLPKFAKNIKFRHNRMAHATEIKMITKKTNAKYAELPVRISYSADSTQKGQSNFDALKILKDLAYVYIFDGSL